MDLGGFKVRFEKWEEEAFVYLTSLYENFFQELSEKCMECFRIDSKELFSNDVKELTKLPGIGAKSAQRIILELKDKLKTEESIIEEDNMEIKNIVTSDNNMQEALSALQVLGYPQKEAAKAISSVDIENLSVEEIIKNNKSKIDKHLWTQNEE